MYISSSSFIYYFSFIYFFQGNGIAGAKIFIGGMQMAISDSDGSYHLENMKTGKYNIQVVSDKIFFEEVSLKITPNTPQLPDIVASR